MKRTFRKIHRTFVKVMNWLCGTYFLLCLCAVKFDTVWAIVAFLASGLWLLGYAWANGMFYGSERGGAKSVQHSR